MNTVDIIVPELPESVTDATVATWHKRLGDVVIRDEVLVEIETDKVILEVSAPISGVLDVILEKEGSIVVSNQKLGHLRIKDITTENNDVRSEEILSDLTKKSLISNNYKCINENDKNAIISPSVRRLLTENNIDVNSIKGSGTDGRILREDVEKFLLKEKYTKLSSKDFSINNRTENRISMTRLRKRIAERLLETKNSTAMLTTFNEVNMNPIMDIRKRYREIFEKRHDVRLGLMSFFVRAVVESLKLYPEINAFIDGEDIIYHNYFDISIAISTPRGLITPVLRDANFLDMADIEKKIKDLALKGREGKLTVEDLVGGNFTITNGGIFGSLMSTPIINPPQSAILGMHAIKDRPIAINGEVEVLPMMYLALSYDHRLIDGRESVSFLIKIKEFLEDPIRLLLNI